MKISKIQRKTNKHCHAENTDCLERALGTFWCYGETLQAPLGWQDGGRDTELVPCPGNKKAQWNFT